MLFGGVSCKAKLDKKFVSSRRLVGQENLSFAFVGHCNAVGKCVKSRPVSKSVQSSGEESNGMKLGVAPSKVETTG